jgi:hypothetical protein
MIIKILRPIEAQESLETVKRLTEQEPVNSRREEADRLLRWLVQKG